MKTRILTVMMLMMSVWVLGTPVPSGAEVCPVTSPNGITPSGERPNPNWYYQNGIYVSMDGEGFIHAKTEDGGETGWIKAIVYHVVDSETFEVESRYLGGKDLHVDARIDPAFGRETPIHVGSITFPSDGCWELTYSTNTATMTFVVDVRFVEEWSATPRP